MRYNPTDAEHTLCQLQPAANPRTKRLNQHGYRALRFWNNEVIDNIEGVLHTIQQALNEPHPFQHQAQHDNPGAEVARGRHQYELNARFNLSDVEAIQESQSDRADRLATLVGAGIIRVEEARRELDV